MNAQEIIEAMGDATEPDKMSADDALIYYEEVEEAARTMAVALRDDIRRRDEGGS